VGTEEQKKEEPSSPTKTFPELQIRGNVLKLRAAGTELQNLLIEAASSASKVTLTKATASRGKGQLALDGTLQNDGALNVNARVSGLALESLIEEPPSGEEKIGLAGTIDGAHLSLHGTDIFSPGFENRLTASLQSNFSELRLPSRFQDVPPINIVFLPFSVFSKIISTLGSAILPAELSAAGGEFKSSLGEQGRLYIKKGVFDMKLENGVVTLPSMELNTNLLPTVQFEGTIGLNRKVDLVSRIKLAEVLLPLPIGGTLDAPLPDVPAFIPEVIKSLGLSVTGIFGRFIPALDPKNKQAPRDLDSYLDSLKKELPAPQPALSAVENDEGKSDR
jgi:hypothetical protein